MRLILTFICTCALASGCAGSPQPQEDPIYAPDDSVESMRCLNLGLVTDTDVVNDRNIVFEMRSRDLYRNVLPKRCVGLFREKAFTYRTTLGRICEGDLISVLEGFDFGDLSGPLCRLGKFYPISRPELEALYEEADLIREYGIEDKLE